MPLVGPVSPGAGNPAPTMRRATYLFARRFCSPSNSPLAVSLTKRVPKNCAGEHKMTIGLSLRVALQS